MNLVKLMSLLTTTTVSTHSQQSTLGISYQAIPGTISVLHHLYWYVAAGEQNKHTLQHVDLELSLQVQAAQGSMHSKHDRCIRYVANDESCILTSVQKKKKGCRWFLGAEAAMMLFQ